MSNHHNSEAMWSSSEAGEGAGGIRNGRGGTYCDGQVFNITDCWDCAEIMPREGRDGMV